MKRTIARSTLLAIAACWAVLFVVPSAEAATGSVTAVKQCVGGTCSATIGSNGVAHDIIQASVSVRSDLTEQLKAVRLSARSDTSKPFTCLVQWSTSVGLGGTFSNSLKWDTTRFPAAPSGCSTANGNNTALYGALTPNGTLQLRAESLNSAGAWSSYSPYTIQLNNAPSTPAWAADPSVSGAAQRHPVVTLQWKASPEPDVKEYRFLRTDSSGQSSAYPVSAANFAQQGCSFDGTTYTCHDTNFPTSGFGGTYSYAVVSLRPSPVAGETCYFDQSNCISSQTSDVRSVTITEPPAPTSSTSSGAGTPQSNPVVGPASVPTGTPSIGTTNRDGSPTHVLGQSYGPNDCFTCGTYKETLPYGTLPGDSSQAGGIAPSGGQQRPVLAAGTGVGSETDARDPRQLWVSFAGGLVLLLTAGHVARVLRATAH
ncbi:MAG: hypothetical protein ACXVQY_08185 [Actinomycetota bacterium]